MAKMTKESNSEFLANVQLAKTNGIADKANLGYRLSFSERLALALELSPSEEKDWTK